MKANGSVVAWGSEDDGGDVSKARGPNRGQLGPIAIINSEMGCEENDEDISRSSSGGKWNTRLKRA